jgi:hypothetical protein
MKFKAVLFAAAIAAIAASVGWAAPPPGKGNSTATTTAAAAPQCGSTVSYILNGKFTAAGTDSFTFTVTHSNKHGVKAGKNATVYVDATTKFARNGEAAKLADLVAGDRLNVQARACRKADAATLKLVAKRVVAHAPATTTTSTTTTTTSTEPAAPTSP